MSTTEVLRRMLDERGVKWHNRDSESDHDDCLVFKTWWKGNLFYEESYPNGDSYTLLEARAVEGITPEQAIEATLGRETCHLIDTQFPTGDDSYFKACSGCGFWIYNRYNWEDTRFCPHCGRKVVDE